MTREDIIATLKAHEQVLRDQGVAHAALFGSRARGNGRPDSDTDIMIEIAPAKGMDVYAYVGLKLFIEGLFEGPVDVVNRSSLKPYVRPEAVGDAIYAF